MGLVVDLGPGYAVANPLKVSLSGYPAKMATRAYHLYAIPRLVNRWAVAMSYLTDAVFDRSVVSVGLATPDTACFSASEGISIREAGLTADLIDQAVEIPHADDDRPANT